MDKDQISDAMKVAADKGLEASKVALESSKVAMEASKELDVLSVEVSNLDIAVPPAEGPIFLGFHLDPFTLTKPTVVRYGVEGKYVTILLQAGDYLVRPETFNGIDPAFGVVKSAYAMPDGTPVDPPISTTESAQGATFSIKPDGTKTGSPIVDSAGKSWTFGTKGTSWPGDWQIFVDGAASAGNAYPDFRGWGSKLVYWDHKVYVCSTPYRPGPWRYWDGAKFVDYPYGDPSIELNLVFNERTGDQFATVSVAIQGANAGDTLLIAPGSRVFPVDIDRSIKLKAKDQTKRWEISANSPYAPPNGDKGKIYIHNYTHTGPQPMLVEIEDCDNIGTILWDNIRAGVWPEADDAVGFGFDLRLRRMLIKDHSNGFLGGNRVGMKSRIEGVEVEFANCGNGDGRTHNTYFPMCSEVILTRCRSVGANIGHLIKSRARKTVIDGCALLAEDSTASATFDAAHGGDVLITNSVLTKGPNADNKYFLIFYGRESAAYDHSFYADKFKMTGNLIVNFCENPNIKDDWIDFAVDRVAIQAGQKQRMGTIDISGNDFAGYQMEKMIAKYPNNNLLRLDQIEKYDDNGKVNYRRKGVIQPAHASLSLSGPSTGLVGQASENFTVGVTGSAFSGVITSTSTGVGTSNPVTLSKAGTFTHTESKAGTYDIGLTNTGGASNPAVISFTAKDAGLKIPAWRKGMKAGEWKCIKSANLAVTPVAASEGVRGTDTWNPGCQGEDFTNWTGSAVSKDCKQYVFAPGGHGSNPGNDGGGESWNGTAMLDWMKDAPQFVLFTKPSLWKHRTYDSFTGFYADNRPASTHNYNWTQYVESRNRVFRFNSTTTWGNGNSGSNAVASLDVTTGIYDPPGYSPDCPIQMRDGCVASLPNGDVFVQGGDNLGTSAIWRNDTNKWYSFPFDGKFGNQSAPGAVDSRRNRVLVIQPNLGSSYVVGPFVRDLTTGVATRFKLLGVDETKLPWGDSGHAIVFHRAAAEKDDCFFVTNGSLVGTVYKINAVTGEVTLWSSNKTGSAIPGANRQYGCYNRFIGMPALKGIGYIAGPKEDGVWFLCIEEMS